MRIIAMSPEVAVSEISSAKASRCHAAEAKTVLSTTMIINLD